MFTKSFMPSLLLISLLTACGGGSNKPAAGPGGGMPPPEVDVITAGRGNATLTQDLPGRLQAYRTAEVRARVEGVIEKRMFDEGSDVKAGMPLYRIDAHTYQAVADAAKADLALARQTVERYQPLLPIHAVSQQEYDVAVARVKQAQAVWARAAEDLQNASVPASISGRIGRSLVTEGAFVGKNEPTLLATIEQLDPIYVNFNQSGSDILRLKQAVRTGRLKPAARTAKVELLLEDGTVYAHEGEIFFTDMAVDPATGSVSLRAKFANPERELLPGMFVHLRFPESLAENVMLVPQRAVQSGPQGQFVMAVIDGKAVPVPVKTGGMTGTDFIIEEGLKGGEQLIVNGLQKARPGTEVKAVPQDASAPAAKPLDPKNANVKPETAHVR